MTSGNITVTFTPIVCDTHFLKQDFLVPLFPVRKEAGQRSTTYPESIEAWQLGRNGLGELCLRGYDYHPEPISIDESQVCLYVLCGSGNLYVWSDKILADFKAQNHEVAFYKYYEEIKNNKEYKELLKKYIGHLTFAAADYYLNLHKKYDAEACKTYFENEDNVKKVGVIMAGLLSFNDDRKSVKWANTGSGHFKPDNNNQALQRAQDYMTKVLCIGNEKTKFGDFHYDETEYDTVKD